MRNNKLKHLLGAAGWKVTAAFMALALAAGPAWLEHRARLAESDVNPKPAGPPSPPAAPQDALQDALQDAAAAADELAALLPTNPELLEQVKDQIADRPDFDAKSARYEELILAAARRHEVNPALIKAVIQAESRFNSSAVSSQGAVGLMQILPSTARSMGFSSPYEPKNNIDAGVLYLKTLLEEFGDDEYLALAAYNCGPDAIRRYGNAMPPFRETKTFVAKVMRYYQSYLLES
jgi:soluble lytic murein transglycosylase-like protein